MRILIVTQIFLPEMGAQSNRLYPITRELVAAGHQVFVATGMPNYPEGAVFPAYRGKLLLREQLSGVDVLRTAHYTAPRNRSRWSQLMQYLSFIPAAFCSGLRAGKLDVVFVTSPPLFSAIPAIWLARLRRAKLIFDVRDLWPDEIVACGGARQGSLAVRAVSAIERWVYRSATCICCTTQPFIETIVGRGVPREKTLLIPNGADIDLFRPLPANNPIVDQYPFGNRFVILYAGVLGIKHGLEVILEVARLLRHQRDIVFFLLGSGAQREALTELADKMALDNVIFGGQRSVEEIPHLLARAGICLSALLPRPYLEKIITVKVFEYLACEKPVVAAVAGETARLLRESGGGLVVSPNDSHAMADAILSLYQDEERRMRMGKVGRRYVEKNFSRSVWAARFEKALPGRGKREQKENALPRLGETRSAESQVSVMLILASVILSLAFVHSPVPTTPTRPASGTLYYVSPDGLDSNVGDFTRPFRTVSRGSSILGAGDVLYLRGGTYVEDVAPTLRAGTSRARITVRNYPGEKPVIKGKVRLAKPDYWTFDGFNVTWNTGNYNEHMVKFIGGQGWILQNSEIWGARSFANILVCCSPSDWIIRKNVVHDTEGGEANTFRSHNIYVNTNLDAGSGLIEHNLFFNAPHGCNVKIAGPDQGSQYGSANVTVRYNTLYNAVQPLLIGDGSRNILVERNIIGKGVRPKSTTYLLRLYKLTGANNIVRNNLGFDAEKWCLDYDGGSSTCAGIDGGGNLFPVNPEFDSIGIDGFRPQHSTAKAYGR